MSEAPDHTALLLQVSADNSKMLRSFETAVTKIDRYCDTLEKRTKKAGNSMERAFEAPNIGKALGKLADSARLGVLEEGSARLRIFGSALEPLGVFGIAAAAGVAAFALAMERTEKAVDFAANIEKLSETIGVSTDFIQQFNFAAHQNEIDIGAADESLKKFNVTLGLVQSGLARSLQVKAFAALKFTPEQLRGYHDAGELFPVLAQRIAGIGNAAEQAAIAKRLGIEELLPLLKQGADGFSALAQKAQDLGIIMDSATIEKAAEAKKKLTELDDVMKAKANVSFAQFADTLVDVKQKFLDAELAALSFLAVLTNTVPAAERMKQLRDSIAQKEAGGLGFHPFGNNSSLADQKKELGLLEGEQALSQRLAALKTPAGPPAKQLIPPTQKAAKADPTGGFDKSAVDAYDAGLKALIEAQGALLVDVQLRAASEKAAVDAGLAKKLDDLTAEEVKIKASKNDRNKAAQLGEIAVAKAEEEAAAVARRDLIDRQTAEALRQQALANQQQEIDGQGQLVSLAQGLTFSETLRQKYALELVDLAYQRTRAELEGLIASKTASEAEKRLAQLKLDQLNAQHPLEVENARRTGSAPSQTVNSIVGGIKQQDSRIEQERAAYAEIERLRQTDVLSEQRGAAGQVCGRRAIQPGPAAGGLRLLRRLGRGSASRPTRPWPRSARPRRSRRRPSTAS
jgi:hypothetical protein